MSFIGVLEDGASAVETALLNAGKDLINNIDNVTVTELIPDLETALLSALKTLEQTVIAKILGEATATAAPPPQAAS